jgi:hypothetical protein
MLNAVVAPTHVVLCKSRARRALIDRILADCRTALPDILFEFEDRSETVNAQAIARGAERVVKLYGGLAFHPRVGGDAIAFAMLHEAGHLRAAGHRFASDPFLACDCAADIWAIETGAPILRKATGRRLALATALDQLEAVLLSIAPPTSRRARNVRRRKFACWATSWVQRKTRLGSGREIALASRCRQ